MCRAAALRKKESMKLYEPVNMSFMSDCPKSFIYNPAPCDAHEVQPCDFAILALSEHEQAWSSECRTSDVQQRHRCQFNNFLCHSFHIVWFDFFSIVILILLRQAFHPLVLPTQQSSASFSITTKFLISPSAIIRSIFFLG